MLARSASRRDRGVPSEPRDGAPAPRDPGSPRAPAPRGGATSAAMVTWLFSIYLSIITSFVARLIATSSPGSCAGRLARPVRTGGIAPGCLHHVGTRVGLEARRPADRAPVNSRLHAPARMAQPAGRTIALVFTLLSCCSIHVAVAAGGRLTACRELRHCSCGAAAIPGSDRRGRRHHHNSGATARTSVNCWLAPLFDAHCSIRVPSAVCVPVTSSTLPLWRAVMRSVPPARSVNDHC